MKELAWILLLLLLNCDLFSQVKQENHSEFIPTTVQELKTHLGNQMSSDSAKILAYYQWITENIKYDEEVKFSLVDDRKKQTNGEVLKRRRAICGEYAQLFKSLCELDSIEVHIVSGYARQRPFSKLVLNEPDHAWNVVLLNGEWQLLDLTWSAAAVQNPQTFSSSKQYLLPEPDDFILSHLPSLPFWQLLDCPVPAQVFEHSRDSVLHWRSKNSNCYSYEDSIQKFLSVPSSQRSLEKAIHQYNFFPSKGNKRGLAQQYIDLENNLTEKAEGLQVSGPLEDLVSTQIKMHELCKKASGLASLFDNQLENCAYTQFNLGVSLFQLIQKKGDKLNNAEKKEKYHEVLYHFNQAKSQLIKLPQNFMTENAVSQLSDHINSVKESINFLE